MKEKPEIENITVDILIVDDRPENLLTLESLLEATYLNIVKAESGAQALELSLEHDFGLIILDVQMPEMDGFETAEHLRITKRTKNIPIIFVTAISKEKEYIFKGYERGAVDYLPKPIDTVILRSKVKVFVDLHKQKRALERATAALEKTVGELKQSEKTLRNREEILLNRQKMDTIGRLVSGVAREINNPLSSKISNLRKLTRNLNQFASDAKVCPFKMAVKKQGHSSEFIETGTNCPCHQKRFSEIVETAQTAIDGGYRIRDIVRDLMLCTPQDDERVAPIRINGVVEKALKLTGYDVKYRACLKKELGDVPLIYANESLMLQVFLNLLVNATHAIEAGGGGQNEIFVRTWIESDDILTQVSDTGRGISKEHLEHVFDPFFTTKPQGEGYGLGLTICQGVIQSLGGNIEVQSKVDRGSQFTIHLPLKRNSTSPRYTPDPAGL